MSDSLLFLLLYAFAFFPPPFFFCNHSNETRIPILIVFLFSFDSAFPEYEHDYITALSPFSSIFPFFLSASSIRISPFPFRISNLRQQDSKSWLKVFLFLFLYIFFGQHSWVGRRGGRDGGRLSFVWFGLGYYNLQRSCTRILEQQFLDLWGVIGPGLVVGGAVGLQLGTFFFVFVFLFFFFFFFFLVFLSIAEFYT